MNAEDSEDEITDDAADADLAAEPEAQSDAAEDDNDFEEFEAGAENEDFGEFDEVTQQPDVSIATAPKSELAAPTVQSLSARDIPYVSTLCAKKIFSIAVSF